MVTRHIISSVVALPFGDHATSAVIMRINDRPYQFHAIPGSARAYLIRKGGRLMSYRGAISDAVGLIGGNRLMRDVSKYFSADVCVTKE